MERRIRPDILWIILISFLFLPLIYISLANIYYARTPTIGPDRIRIFRIGIFMLAALCAGATLILERRMAKSSAGNGSGQIFVFGLLVLLIPSSLSLFLFLLGTPKMDLYIFAGFSFAGILGWAWRHRELFLPEGREIERVRPDASPVMAAPPRDIPARPLNSYTILLICVGCFSLAVLCLRVLYSFTHPDQKPAVLALNPPLILYEILMMLGCWITAFLRKNRSPYALKATTVITAMLVPGFPLGTAIFFYWIASVRKKVNRAANCRYF